VNILLTLKNRSNATRSNGKYSWAAISRLVQNITGQIFDYNSFQVKYDTSPALQQIVSDFDNSGLTLTVNSQANSDQVSNVPSNGSDIKSSAKSAAEKTLQRNK
jgi:hypothetical protein